MPYCKDCKYHIAYSPTLHQRDPDATDGRHICGSNIRTEFNAIGDEVFKMVGEIEYCEECHRTVRDNRKMVFERCLEKNMKHNCKEFISKTRSDRLRDFQERVIMCMGGVVAKYKFSRLSALAALLFVSVLFANHYAIWDGVPRRSIITYCIIIIPFIAYLARRS